jgi:hypothetical protein
MSLGVGCHHGTFTTLYSQNLSLLSQCYPPTSLHQSAECTHRDPRRLKTGFLIMLLSWNPGLQYLLSTYVSEPHPHEQSYTCQLGSTALLVVELCLLRGCDSDRLILPNHLRSISSYNRGNPLMTYAPPEDIRLPDEGIATGVLSPSVLYLSFHPIES